MELVAKGSQDIYLTGNPQMTFFKVIYKRHTNFSIESIEQPFKGDVNFGQKIELVLSRSGDLLSNVIIEFNLPKIESTQTPNNLQWISSIGHGLIETVDISIGGNLIDRHYGEWLEIWSELSLETSKKYGYRNLVGNRGKEGPNNACTLYVPLQFWFCRNIGLALPLIALQYHEVKLEMQLRKFNECWRNNTMKYHELIQEQNYVIKTDGIWLKGIDDNKIMTWPNGIRNVILEIGPEITDQTLSPALLELSGHPKVARVNNVQNLGSFESPIQDVFTKSDELPLKEYDITSAKLFTDYIYLDTVERKKFAQIPHNYLIEQLQFNGNKGYQEGQTENKIELDFKHPTKELIWIHQSLTYQINNDLFDFVSPRSNITSQDSIESAILFINGQERFTERSGRYFKAIQPYLRHTAIPNLSKNIYVYSFALSPENHQPSGTCNFSRIDNSDLLIKFRKRENETLLPEGNTRIYATNYNILRIQNGMGGVAYSN